MDGLILSSRGGFYQVLCDGDPQPCQCRGRGRFRKDDTQLLVGDRVTVQPTGPGTGFIVDLAPRRNHLIRPPIANISRLALVVSAQQPAPHQRVNQRRTAKAAPREQPR